MNAETNSKSRLKRLSALGAPLCAGCGGDIGKAPQARQPLTEAQVTELCAQLTMEPYQVRAVEAALGIGVKQ